jgi:hypothetical protein
LFEIKGKDNVSPRKGKKASRFIALLFLQIGSMMDVVGQRHRIGKYEIITKFLSS